ncbi:MAG: BlaI/MecI/CopY family transcriptional regulator [Wujia sp.]
MSKKVPEIFECEYQLMTLIWNNKGSIRMRQLVADGFEAREWKRTTIYTMVKRLSDRGVLKFQDGIVTAKFTKEQVQLAKADEFLNKIYDGSITNLMSAFTGKKKLKKAEAEEIQTMLDDYIKNATK